MFDTLKYSKVLEAAGVTRLQAEAHVQIIAEIVEADLATKQDIGNVRQDIQNVHREVLNIRREVQQDLQNFRQEVQTGFVDVNRRIDSVASNLKSEMLQVEYRQTIKLGAIVAACVATAVAVLKLI